MIETLANGYSSESTLGELSNEYQYDRVGMFFKNLCILVLWTKVASALKGLTLPTIFTCVQSFLSVSRGVICLPLLPVPQCGDPSPPIVLQVPVSRGDEALFWRSAPYVNSRCIARKTCYNMLYILMENTVPQIFTHRLPMYLHKLNHGIIYWESDK